MSSAGNIVFANLALIFAVGVAIGLARNDKGTAGLAAVLGYLVMNATINAMLTITGELAESNLAEVGQGTILGIQTLETGVFGGDSIYNNKADIQTVNTLNKGAIPELPEEMLFTSAIFCKSLERLEILLK